MRIAVALFGFVDRQILILVAAPLSRDRGLRDAALGTIQGLGLALVAAVASYPLGWGSATAACGLAPFSALMAGAIGMAAGEAALGPAIVGLLSTTIGSALLFPIVITISTVGLAPAVALLFAAHCPFVLATRASALLDAKSGLPRPPA